MSHADVAALLGSAVLVPGRLRAFVTAETEDGEALRRHLAECEECRHELRAWESVDEALVAVAPPSLVAPPAARSRILSNVLATGVARGPDRVLGAPGSAAAAPGTVAAPSAGRFWRTPDGTALPAPAPVPMPGPIAVPAAAAGPDVAHDQAPPAGEVPSPGRPRRGRLRALAGGGDDGDGVGFRIFLAVAAAAVFLFALGAALGGPLGLSPSATAPDTTAQVELEKVVGRLSDLLELPSATVAPLTDRLGEPAGAVMIATPDSDLLAVVTRALPVLPEGSRYVCLLEREGERYEIGFMRFSADPVAPGDVAYWVGPLKDDVPPDTGAPGDRFLVYRDGETSGEPLLSATF